MTASRIQWRHAPDRREEARQAARQGGLNPVLAHALLNRGLSPDQFDSFLNPDRGNLGDPALLPDMQPAAERVVAAIQAGRKVCVYGDFDADGCTAGALLTRFLSRRDVPTVYYVPGRFVEGYGVHAEALVKIITQHKPDLLVTVDCGISSAEELETAKALGVDVVVTDHHQVPERLPAVPAVNPHRAESEYPFADLCGAAVAYRLCCRVAELLGEDPLALEAELLDLVAIGTIADVMPLLGENRYYAAEGLRRLANSDKLGIRALVNAAKVGGRGLSARDIGFGLGPRLNAAGRLGSAYDAFQLLVTTDEGEAIRLSEQLDRLNRERREIEARIGDEALEQLRGISLHEVWGLVVHGQDWHHGVIGLVAGRLARRHHRPALAVTITEDGARGSGRSPETLDLHAAISECGELLDGYGGHPRAVGFTLPSENVKKLVEKFNEVVRGTLTEDDLIPSLTIECKLKGTALTLDLARELQRLEPYGEGNPEPIFEVDGLRIGRARATRDGKHLQLEFATESNGRSRPLKGFWPRLGAQAERLEEGLPVTVAGTLQVDAWQGREQPQLMVQDLKLQRGGAD